MTRKPAKSRNRLAGVVLDEATIPRGAADVDHERAVAIFDLIEENAFAVPGRDDGPYTLMISQEESKLTFDVRTAGGELAASIVVSTSVVTCGKPTRGPPRPQRPYRDPSAPLHAGFWAPMHYVQNGCLRPASHPLRSAPVQRTSRRPSSQATARA